MDNLTEIIQSTLALLAMASALCVVLSKRAVLSAMFLLSTLFFTGALYFGLGAHFVGAVQILVYAGAVAILFVFILMLLDEDDKIEKDSSIFKNLLYIFSSFPLFFLLSFLFMKDRAYSLERGANIASAEDISWHLLTKYMFSFQMAGLLLLIAVLGVVVLGANNKFKSKSKELGS